MSKVASNIPKAKLRWSILRASEEFEVDYKTLTGNIEKLAIEPDSGGCYTTADIRAALSPADKRFNENRNKLTIEQTRNIRLKNEVAEANLYDANLIRAHLNKILTSMVQQIKSTDLSTDKQDTLIETLAKIISGLKEVEAEQRATVS